MTHGCFHAFLDRTANFPPILTGSYRALRCAIEDSRRELQFSKALLMTIKPHHNKSASAETVPHLRREIRRLQQDLEILSQQHRTLRQAYDQRIKGLEENDRADPHKAQALQLAELIIANSPAILFRRLAADDPKQRKMVYVSPNIARFGYRAEDFISGRIMFRDILYDDDSDRILKEIQSFVRRHIETYTQVYRIVTRDGDIRWVEDRTSVVDDPLTGRRYHQGIVIDIHRRKEAEEKLRKSEEKYRRIVETAGEGFLLLDQELKIVDLNSAYARMVGCRRAELIGQSPFQKDTDLYARFWSGSEESSPLQDLREFEGVIKTCGGRAKPVLFHANTVRSDTGRLIGKMAFVTDLTEHKKALALAAEVQRSLLPDRAPRIPGLEIAGRNQPCEEIGGDYFDYLWQPGAEEGPFSLVVGDITGHGVDSALLMSSARAFLRMRASQPGTLADIVTAMNQHLTGDVHESGRFMTLFYLTIDGARRGIEWIRAGHDPALVYDYKQDRFRELKGPGLALGVDQHFTYQVQTGARLKPGRILLLGTDGIWEACNTQGEMFGKERFQAIVRQNAKASAARLLDTVFQAQAAFSRGVKQADDITLVIVKVLP
jgi:sigma-B regulation protein RsbU (phosphoserine phosphatase)